ncbi:MAG: hypothetical protein OEO77_10600 [Acidimicrobiia bacterium]|nr:hypothetical protein [Acidimicrobiia bacterium]
MGNPISIQLQNYSFPGNFEGRCVYCGNQQSSELSHKVDSTEGQGDQSVKHQIEIRVPYCEEHLRIARRNRFIWRAKLTTGFLVGLPVAAYVAVYFYSHVMDNGIFGLTEGLLFAVLGLAAVAALAFGAGVVGVFGPVLLLGVIIDPIVRKVTGSPVDDPLGLVIRVRDDTQAIDLLFHSDEVAESFREANAEFIEPKALADQGAT